jgi:hypothetical protein
MPGTADDDEQKRIVKAAIKEWLDEQFLAFGKWTAFGFAAAVFSAVVYFVLRAEGWVKH